jgi:DNA-binding CsgD family transcriptional regulator
VLNGLASLMGCDGITYEAHDVGNRRVLPYQATTPSLDWGHDFWDESVQDAFWTRYWRGLCDYWPRTGDFASARRMFAEPEWRTWQKCVYGEWIRSIGVRGEITVALPPCEGRQYRLLLWRLSGRDFTERDCLLLTLIYPRLAALHTAVLRRQAGTIDLTPRQWELMHLIAAGHTNRQIASRLGLSEGTVRTHCENVFRRLHVTNRLAAVARVFPDTLHSSDMPTAPSTASHPPGPAAQPQAGPPRPASAEPPT